MAAHGAIAMKLVYPEDGGTIRRIRLEAPYTMAALIAAASSAARPFWFFDDEGDRCIVESDLELEEAVRVHQDLGRVAKLSVGGNDAPGGQTFPSASFEEELPELVSGARSSSQGARAFSPNPWRALRSDSPRRCRAGLRNAAAAAARSFSRVMCPSPPPPPALEQVQASELIR